jgi:hypothetical protein
MIRTILLACSFLLVSCISYSQVPPSGSNIIRPNLDQFEGIWKWTSGNDEITIKLKKINFFFITDHFHEDVIIGSHKYIKDGIVVEDYLSQFPSIGQNNLSTIFLWGKMDGSEADKIAGNLKDANKHKQVKLLMVLIPGTTPTINCKITPKGDVIVDPMIEGTTLPEDFILIKQ